MRPLEARWVSISDPFWRARQEAIFDVGLRAQLEQIESTGRLENFRRCARGESGGHQGRYYDDSDVYKWLEAAAYAVQQHPDHPIRPCVEEVVSIVANAQEPSGYIDTFFQLMHPDKKFTNLSALHEMYCMGHLIEAGVAHRQAFGDSGLYGVAKKAADHIAATFGPGKRVGFCGHEELELALIRLDESESGAGARGEYWHLAKWMVDQRGRRPSIFENEIADAEAMKLSPWMPQMVRNEGSYSGEYLQDHAPVSEHSFVVGHAVRSMYLYAAASETCDLGDPTEAALQRVWDNLTTQRMYITGGIGPAAHNEGFTTDYDLPHRTAYAETCAAVGLALWGERMGRLTGEARYWDVVERALYNGMLSGVSLSGDRYFYTNPLESQGEHSRTPWFSCACCPPNVARLIGSIGSRIASVGRGPEGSVLWIHLPVASRISTPKEEGEARFQIGGAYPNPGVVTVQFQGPTGAQIAVALRVPWWCESASFAWNGERFEPKIERGYAVIRREWKQGDTLSADFSAEPTWYVSNPKNLSALGRACLMVGPIVYCLEEADLGAAPHRFVADVAARPQLCESNLMGHGLSEWWVKGSMENLPDGADLYAPLEKSDRVPVTARFIPYMAWCNRGANAMQVWVRKET